MADIIPVHKKDNTSDKANYRLISILPTVSKDFEKLVLKDYQACVDKSGKVGAILMDLSKAYDCLPHDLLIAKLSAYGIGRKSLRFLYSYLTSRKHRVKIGSSISEWLEVFLGVPQGSILGPILFNIFINDLLFSIEKCDICNFADDNSLYDCDDTFNKVLSRLNFDLRLIIDWFHCNSMVANPEKFQVIFLGNKNNNEFSLNINDIVLNNSATVKLLGVVIDDKLSFIPQIIEICNKTDNATNGLLRIRRNLTREKAELLNNAYILSRFNYCPLIWMFCGKKGNSLINKTHKRALRVVLNDFSSPLEELLQQIDGKTIHHTNLCKLLNEVYKSVNSLNPKFMWDIFTHKVSYYNLRGGKSLDIPSVKSSIGHNSVHFRGSLAWNGLKKDIKEAPSLTHFKTGITKLKKIYCRCKICT